MEDANADKERRYISSFPEFAEIFLFLKIFGPLINLPAVTLKALEDFFMNGKYSFGARLFVSKIQHFSPCFSKP